MKIIGLLIAIPITAWLAMEIGLRLRWYVKQVRFELTMQKLREQRDD